MLHFSIGTTRPPTKRVSSVMIFKLIFAPFPLNTRVAEEHATFEKTVKSLKAAHEEQLKAAAEKMKQSCSEHAKL